MGRNYVGPLLDSLGREDPLEVSTECNDAVGHSVAVHQTILAICMGRQVKLTRTKDFPSHDEIPGEVEGTVYGMSHHFGNRRVVLAIQTASGECLGVDVSDPADWDWEVSRG